MAYEGERVVKSTGSNTNRWLSPDIIVPDPANPQSFNRYSYVNNNPLNFTDPTGHCSEDPYFDNGGCLELESWILGQLDSGAKYIVLDDFIFDMPHAETNWFLAMDIYTQWATGTVELEWSGFTAEYVVDLSLTGEALDQAAFNLWLDFVVSKEIDQAKHFSPSAFSIEDLPSNYVGFISYVNGSRDPDNRWSDMATTLADFGSSNFPMGERYAFGQRDTHEISRGEHIFQELEAATYRVYRYRNFGIEPRQRNAFVVSWQGQYTPPSPSSKGWVPR